MLRRIIKWPRKRPRKGGGPSDLSAAAHPHPLSATPLDINSPPIDLGCPKKSGPSRSEQYSLDAATLVAKATVAISDAPGLGLLKAIASPALLICETLDTMGNNKDAAVDLAGHANHVKDTVIERSTTCGVSPDLKASFERLENAAKESANLAKSSVKRRFLNRFVSAARDRDRMKEMKGKLDDAFNLAAHLSVLARLDRLQNELNVRSSTPSPTDRITIRKLPSEVINLFHRMDGTARTAAVIFSKCADATEVLTWTRAQCAARTNRCLGT
ncbi:hypothetical protein C8R44DRAFT_178696 [Mycena epipterygia]|nr:hypothetical protein C8R44DRAFT_178696 [Mycena epipterygia]